MDGLARDLLDDPRFGMIVEQDLRTGQHRNPTERLDYFTTAYFHRPEDLWAEVLAAGLILEVDAAQMRISRCRGTPRWTVARP